MENEKHHLLNTAIEKAPVPILITTRDGLVVYVNEAFTKNTGYSSEEIVGENPKILQSGLTLKATYKELWDTILSGNPWHGTLCNKNKKGEIYWESISIAPLLDSKGKPCFFVGVWENVTEAKLEEGLQKQRLKMARTDASTDDLTRLYNRRHILIEIEKEVERASRYKRSLSGMMIDVDGLKVVNDRFGHLAGDIVLQKIASTMEGSIRKVDIVGRYGGDEFLVILPEAGRETAKIVAERLRREISKLEFDFRGEKIRLTISIGLLSLDNLDKVDRIVFIEWTDQALLKAKKAGKNQVFSE